jgi:hypothetical protein
MEKSWPPSNLIKPILTYILVQIKGFSQVLDKFKGGKYKSLEDLRVDFTAITQKDFQLYQSLVLGLPVNLNYTAIPTMAMQLSN